MMEADKRERLFCCLKRDDAKAFGEFLTSEVLCLSFGRFPLLSLLYLFDAKRIVKRYYSDLIKERPHVKEPSFPEAENRFRSAAGKALRYYADREVSPFEMLAILGRGKELKKLYALCPAAPRYLPLIHKVYFTRLGKGAFYKCGRLQHAVFSGDLDTVPDELFYGCSDLETVEFAGNVGRIGNNAFYSCLKLFKVAFVYFLGLVSPFFCTF